MNSRTTKKQFEAKNSNTKVYDAYKKQESVITNYQVCKAFFHDTSISILGLVEKILKEKYNLPWQEKFIHKAIMEARGKSNAMISIPKFKFEETTHRILSKYVKRNFSVILADQCNNKEYPFMFRDIIEKYS